MDKKIETVADLIAVLQQFNADLPVRALWDTMTDWEIHRVGLHEGVVLLDVGSGPNGDWDTIEEAK